MRDKPNHCALYQLRTAINSNECNTISQAGITTGAATDADGNKEKQVGDPNDNQAYTCVKIILDTADYQWHNRSERLQYCAFQRRIELRSGSRSPGLARTTQVAQTTTCKFTTSTRRKLPPATEWQTVSPPIMRAQYIPVSGNIEELDNEARTVFLYPQAGGPISARSISTSMLDAQVVQIESYLRTQQVAKTRMVRSVVFVRATLQLPGSTSTSNAYFSYRHSTTARRTKSNYLMVQIQLNLMASHQWSTLLGVLQICSVESMHASRLVVSRLPPPIAAVFTTGNFCKDFYTRRLIQQLQRWKL